jgi:hypothetical protein
LGSPDGSFYWKGLTGIVAFVACLSPHCYGGIAAALAGCLSCAERAFGTLRSASLESLASSSFGVPGGHDYSTDAEIG